MEISLVIADARPAFRAACLAIQEANFVLFSVEVAKVIVGTNRILVPSGNFLELELYHTESLSLTSCIKSTAHSTCKALILSSLAG